MDAVYDIEAVRRIFPIVERMLYFDTAHQAPLSLPVKAALDEFYRDALYAAGPKSKWLERVEWVRARVAKLIGAAPESVAFTKNTSEGLNIAANALPLNPGDNVLLLDGDHPNNAYAFLNRRAMDINMRFVPLSRNGVDLADIERLIDGKTRAISLSHVTFHAGHVVDIAAIARLCSDRGIHLVIDAMQSVGVIPIDVPRLGSTMMAFGCHKGLLVPQGLGVLYVSPSLPELRPVYLAAAGLAHPPADMIARSHNMQLKRGAGRFEIGNYNLPDIWALDASLDIIERVGVENIRRHVGALGDRLIKHLDALGVGLVGPREPEFRCHIYVLDLPVEPWLSYFAGQNVRVSPERDGIRISFALFNSADDVDRLSEILANGIKQGMPRKRARAEAF
jgi:cysteine desulfurase/selenocysteine lyase